jgi:acetyl esterase
MYHKMKKMKCYTFGLLFFFALTAQAQEIRLYKETKEGVKLYISIHKPNVKAENTTAMLFFHGGGFSGGSPVKFVRHGEYFVSRGITVIHVNYRIRKVHNSTAMQSVSDAKAAMRYVRAFAEELGIDANKIIATGGSAGGHLAASCALLQGFEEDNDNLEISCIPNALVLFNPVFKIATKEEGGYNAGDWAAQFPDNSFSPWHNIKKGAPATIVFFGTEDKHVSPETAEAYKQSMEEVGSRCDLLIYEGQKHGFFNYRETKPCPYFVKTVFETDRFLASLGYLDGEPTIARFQFGELIDPMPETTKAFEKADKE